MINPTRIHFIRSTPLLSILLLVLCVAPAFMQVSGTPDLSFGDAGLVLTPVWPGYGQKLEDAVLQPDGKLIAVGYLFLNNGSNLAPTRFLLVRYNRNGSLDSTFGNEGVSAALVGTAAKAKSAALQSDGKILVTGEYQGDVAIARYSTNGALDPSFGVGGLIVRDFADLGETSNEIPSKIIVGSDGKILVVMIKMAYPSGGSPFETRSTIIVARYNPDGSPDDSFGINGIARRSLAFYDSFIWHVFEGNDGSIFVHCNGSGPEDPNNPHSIRIFENLIAKFTSTGNLATNFGRRGTLRYFNGVSYKIFKVLPNRQLLVSQGNKLLLFNNNGSYQSEIISGSELTINGIRFQPQGFVIQSDGKILATGKAPDSAPNFQGFARLLPNGQVDTSFGNNGLALTAPIGGNEKFISLLQTDGKLLIVTGTGYNPFRFIVARYNGDEPASRSAMLKQ